MRKKAIKYMKINSIKWERNSIKRLKKKGDVAEKD